MKNKISKKKIAVSVTAVTLVVATMVSLLTPAMAAEDRSLEYIELLKQKYTDSYFKILEIAPTDEDGIFGYYVGDSEPIGSWTDKAAMISTPAARETYVNNILNGLLDKNVMSETAGAAPLYLEEAYDEFYPWEISKPEDYKSLKLDTEEQVSVRGNIKATEPGEGSYTASVKYVPAETAYKNFFDYSSWRASLGIPLKEKLSRDFETGKYQSSKIIVPNKDSKTITVFGSTRSNWDYFEAVDSAAVYYDLAAAYSSDNYYVLELEDTAEGTYNLSFDVKSDNGRGQVDIIPLDNNGNNIAYSPNYSKQYWYRSECVETGHYELQFTVPANSKVKYVQFKFDVENIEASAVFSNIGIYKFNKNYFNVNTWKYDRTGNIANSGGKITVTNGKDYFEFEGPGTNEHEETYRHIECSQNSLYTLTYHVENKSGATSKISVYGYDESGKLITEPIAVNEKVSSGTYSISFNSGDAKYLYVFPNAKTTKSRDKLSTYSNISLTRTHDFILDESEATHVQVIDHFESGDIDYTYGSTIFDFDAWHSSSSNGKSIESDKNAAVVSDKEYKTITITGEASTVTADKYKSTQSVYFIPVEAGESYRFSYAVNNNNGKAHKVNMIFSDENKNKVYQSVEEQEATESGFKEYSYEFTVGEGVKWLQIGFENTSDDQRCVYSNIMLNKKEKPEAFFYTVKFTPAGEFDSIADGTNLYIPRYEVVGKCGSYTMINGITYYMYDKYRDEYFEITEETVLTEGSDIYRFTGIYDYVGKKGAEDTSFNIRYEYYTAEINYDGYTKVENTDSLGNGSVYYVKDGNEYRENIVTNETVFEGDKEYFVKSNVVSETKDMAHPYWVAAGTFEASEDHPLFKQVSDGFTYVGEGRGDFDFEPDTSGKTEVIINVDEVFYKGGYKNNEWLKKYVFNVDEANFDNFKVSVTVVSPEYLNKLDEESLNLYLQGYELYVMSYGGLNGITPYSEDISALVKDAIKREVLDERETEDDEEFTYKVPVVVDNRICSCNMPNIKALANELCQDITAPGGVNKYIYKFNGDDINGSSSIVNNNFFKDIGQARYTSSNSPYYAVYYELVYENFIREANKNKYKNIEEIVSEAAFIRYIINFRGQRPQHIKSTIEILEIEPYTEKSMLCDKNGNVYPEVVKWFSTEGNLMYIDSSGTPKPVTINVTTQSAVETAAKNDDIIEKYDVVYVGASKDNLGLVSDTENGLRKDDDGHEIPDYRADELDGCYYTSTGDKVDTGDTSLKRANLAGLVGSDYDTIREQKIEIFGLELFSFKEVEGTILDLWWVDGSKCELRLSGNDISENVQNQLEKFAKAGKPIIYSDELVENEFIGDFTVSLAGITGWQDVNGKHIPVMSMVASLVMPKGQKLPEGVIPSYTWYLNGKKIENPTSGWFDNSTDYTGDGILDSAYGFQFKEGDSMRGYGDYHVEVTFKFSGKRYKGLKDASILSNKLNLNKKDIWYKLNITDYKEGHKSDCYCEAVFEIDFDKNRAAGYKDEELFLPSADRGNTISMPWRAKKGLESYQSGYNKSQTYTVYDKNGNVVSHDYQHPTDAGTKIVTRAEFDGSGGWIGINGFRFGVKVDVEKSDDYSFIVWTAGAADITREIKSDTVRYYNFTPRKEGAYGATVQTQSGIAINDDRMDNSSHMYVATHNIFENQLNAFSEEQLTTNANKIDYVNKLIKYANLSQPEIVVTVEPDCYPETLSNLSLEFKFKINNYTDDDLSTTRYEYKFYVDNNADGKFSEDELTDAAVYGVNNASMSDGYLKASSEERINEYKFYKKFPESTTGVIPWKFAVVEHKKSEDDKSAEYVHYSIERISYIKPSAPKELKVLQVLPVSWKPNYVKGGSGGDEYKGSVFLSDIFDNDKITAKAKRTIYYKDGSAATSSYTDESKEPNLIKFEIGDDFILNIEFSNVDTLNSDENVQQTLSKYDMVILGYADSYGRHVQDGGVSYLGALTNEGFQQSVCKALEKCIDNGQSILLTHDTLSNSNNFVGYITNDILNGASDIISKIVGFFKELFGSKEKENEFVANLHSSRVKQGYYANICLRAKFGQDRYGVSIGLKDRIVARDASVATYSDISYSNENLKDAHDYASLYSDDRKRGAQVLDVTPGSTTEKYVNKYIGLGYDIAYLPNSGRSQVDPYVQGFTDFEIFREKDTTSSDSPQLTNRVTQTNSGRITSYPFDLNKPVLDVATTHAQTYQISLETDKNNSGITVWYCLGNPPDEASYSKKFNSFRNNAVNAYYIYTYGNVTYTGSGHTNTFTLDEAKLFINTIVASYRIVSEKPGMSFTNESGETISHQILTTAADEEKKITAEDDVIYFKLKDTSVNSEAKKALSVRFYLKKEEIKETKDGKEVVTGYKYSEPITDLAVASGGAEVPDGTAAAFPQSEDKQSGLNLEAGAKYLTNLEGDRVYGIKVPKELKDKLVAENVNETEIYGVVLSTSTGLNNKQTTVAGDPVVLNVRELNLRDLY